MYVCTCSLINNPAIYHIFKLQDVHARKRSPYSYSYAIRLCYCMLYRSVHMQCIIYTYSYMLFICIVNQTSKCKNAISNGVLRSTSLSQCFPQRAIGVLHPFHSAISFDVVIGCFDIFTLTSSLPLHATVWGKHCEVCKQV